MYIIGLTGGIGSGKSTVASRLAELGATVVDADRIARDVVEPGEPALKELEEQFPGVIRPDGTLDRAGLARVAFATPEATARLNAVTHPRIRERTAEQFARARAAGVPVLVYDMPLLIETGQTDLVDTVLVVDVPDDIRVDRLVRLRGLDEADARRRIAAQADRETRLAAADTVLDNSGDTASLIRQVDDYWNSLRAG